MLNLVSAVVMNGIVVLFSIIKAVVAQLVIGIVVGILVLTMASGAHASVTPSAIPMYQEEPSWILYAGLMLLIGGAFSVWCSIYEDLEWGVTLVTLVIAAIMIIVGL